MRSSNRLPGTISSAADLQRRMRTPICLDESITSLDRARDMSPRQRPHRQHQARPLGGLASSIAIHDFCEANGIPVWVRRMPKAESAGRKVALASLANFVKPGDVSPSSRYWGARHRDAGVDDDRRGTMLVPEVCGLGRRRSLTDRKLRCGKRQSVNRNRE